MAGRVVVITGASSGIGARTAHEAHARGYRVVLAARSEDRLAEVTAEMQAPDRAYAVPCDTTCWSDVTNLRDMTLAAFGRVDAVFANAGQWTPTSFLNPTTGPEEWRELVLANVLGPALIARAFIPHLITTKGHLVLTGSVAGRIVVPGELYPATKWAITGMAQSIRAEIAHTGVHTTLIQPGLVDTGTAATGRSHEPMLDPGAIADAFFYAIEQDRGVDINEIVIRPAGQRSDR